MYRSHRLISAVDRNHVYSTSLSMKRHSDRQRLWQMKLCQRWKELAGWERIGEQGENNDDWKC